MSVKVDIKGLEELKENLVKMETDFHNFLRSFLIKQALIVLRNTKKNTPKDSGTLQSSWKLTDVTIQGNEVVVYIYNPMEYASYVEYGHMTRNRSRFIPGHFMCTLSIEDIERKIPAKFEREFKKWVRSHGG